MADMIVMFFTDAQNFSKNSLMFCAIIPTSVQRIGRNDIKSNWSYGMKRGILAFALTGFLALPTYAALSVGSAAPDFSAPASIGGKEFSFKLSDALKKGPVVLYFYPAAFTPGCTVEAHEFADATDRFAALGATVIGVSHDNIETLDKFSTTECRSKFAVAADGDQSITKAYDTVLTKKPEYADRTSYVITPDGKVAFAYTNLDPAEHVNLTMKAVSDWKAKH
jgi:peroxiredoxin